MSKKLSAYEQSLGVLKALKEKFPGRTLGQHISTAMDEYGDLWALSDNEFVFALRKYKTTLEYDVAPETDVDKIIKDAENLDKLFEEEDYD